jgi:hypothetical protein
MAEAPASAAAVMPLVAALVAVDGATSLTVVREGDVD